MLLDTATGAARSSGDAGGTPRGTMRILDGRLVALYAQGGRLYLQIGIERWDLGDPATRIRYGHDLNLKTTRFECNGFVLEYPAWWRDDPAYDPFEPELDEDEDYLGYVHAVFQQPALQANLIRAWSGEG